MAEFFLVHGSAQGPTGWKRLVAELEARGHDCRCVDLPVDQPEASATFYAKRIAEEMKASSRPVVVATSASGLFLPLVPRYADVAWLIYLAAVIPVPGESFAAQVQRDVTMYQPDFLRLKPPIDDSVGSRFLFHDCPSELLPWASSTLRMMYAKQAIVEECPLDRMPETPSAYISCSEDRTINPIWWEAAARKRLGVEPLVMKAGHAPFISLPGELAHLLETLSEQELKRS